MALFLLFLAFATLVVVAIITGKYLAKRAYYARLLIDIIESCKSLEDEEVIQRVEQHRWWIEHAGNQSGVRVHYLLFQDEDHPSESWEAYKNERLPAYKTYILKSCHKRILNEYGEEFYHKYVHHQLNGVRLDNRLTDYLKAKS